MAVVNREALLAKRHLNQKQVDVPDIGTVLIREMTNREVEEIVEREKEDPTKTNRLIFAMSVIDEEGRRLFDPSSTEDLKAIDELGFSLIVSVVRTARELSGIAKQSQEDMLKN